jgi:hypothetical protein
MVRQRFPKIVDPIGLSRSHYVVVDGTHFRARIGILDQS